ncbi:MAG TPA: septum formation inhibitor Maf [Clostridiaceae bacterium]|jgi:septum formation protein|nr:septum formation inhibitor Maf [Clostridiaceae bacterium]HBG38636.1 septum formation inhibitor Maf [Clostridiaceae bacterium]
MQVIFLAKFVLASASPRRADILKKLGIDFEVIPSSFDEKSNIKDVRELVKYLAEGKAKDVMSKTDAADVIIVGADTVVYFDNKIIGKPKSEEEAFQILKMLNNKKHEVLTGICVIDKKSNKIITDYEVTNVFFNDLSDEEILSYIKTKEPFDKAGAYGIQGLGSLLVKRIEGCYFNVVGMPVTKLYMILKKMGVNLMVKEGEHGR